MVEGRWFTVPMNLTRMNNSSKFGGKESTFAFILTSSFLSVAGRDAIVISVVSEVHFNSSKLAGRLSRENRTLEV